MPQSVPTSAVYLFNKSKKQHAFGSLLEEKGRKIATVSAPYCNTSWNMYNNIAEIYVNSDTWVNVFATGVVLSSFRMFESENWNRNKAFSGLGFMYIFAMTLLLLQK